MHEAAGSRRLRAVLRQIRHDRRIVGNRCIARRGRVAYANIIARKEADRLSTHLLWPGNKSDEKDQHMLLFDHHGRPIGAIPMNFRPPHRSVAAREP